MATTCDWRIQLLIGGATSPIRVTCLINGLGTGGAERSLADLLPALAARGVSLEFMCLYRRQEGVEGEILGTSRVRFLQGRSWIGRIGSARRMLHASRPHLLHTTLFEADVVGRLAAVGSGVPVLTSLVNTSYDKVRLEVDPNLRPLRLGMTRAIDGFTARLFTDHFHAISTAVKESAVAKLGIAPERVTVVGRARNLERLGQGSPERRQRVRRQLGLDDQHEVVLTVGRQEYQKGQIHLLEAVADLRPARPGLKLVLAGREGNASEQLRDAIQRHQLSDSVLMLGHRSDIGDLLSAADVFCFPSIYEGFGGALLEAMAMGIPIVASDIPALREVLGDGGILIPTRASKSIAEAVDRLLDDRAIGASLAAASRRRVARFDLDRIAGEMATLYRQVAAKGRRGSLGAL